MRLEASAGRKRKGVSRRRIHEHCERIALRSDSDDDAMVLGKLYQIFMKVGVGGLNLSFDRTLEEIAEIEAERAQGQGESRG